MGSMYSMYSMKSELFHVEPDGRRLTSVGSMMYLREFSESGCLGSYDVLLLDFGNDYAACTLTNFIFTSFSSPDGGFADIVVGGGL